MIEQNKARIQQEIQIPLFNSPHVLHGPGAKGPEWSMRMQVKKSKEPRVIQLPTS